MYAIIESCGRQYKVTKGDVVFFEKLEAEEGKKILVYKYKAKKNYRRTQGHRQPYTKVEITNIKTASEKAEDKAATETKTASAKPATTKKADTAKKEA